jgi:hypothetical protein
MSEFTEGAFNFLNRLIKGSSPGPDIHFGPHLHCNDSGVSDDRRLTMGGRSSGTD